MAEPQYVSCVRLEEIFDDLSDDSVNRFLLRERYTPQDLFDEFKHHIILEGGTCSVDDSVIDKPYRDPLKTDLVGYFWSGKHHKAVKGINLITLYYTDIAGNSYPINFRLYDKSEGKTKNDYFREMIVEVISWGVKPAWVTGDSWYSSQDNLKFFKNAKLGYFFAIAKNRKVFLEKDQEVQVQSLTIPKEGLMIYLKEFGWVKVLTQEFKNELRYYILYLPNLEKLKLLTRGEFKNLHDTHWKIETFHRVIKQVCNIERFYIRKTQGIANHFYCSLRVFAILQKMTIEGLMSNVYQVSRQLFIPVIREFIEKNNQNQQFSF